MTLLDWRAPGGNPDAGGQAFNFSTRYATAGAKQVSLKACSFAACATLSAAVTVQPDPPVVTRPAAPSAVQCVPGIGTTAAISVRISWQDNSTNEDGFRVYQQTANGQILRTTTMPNATSSTFLRSSCSGAAPFGVASFNSAGESVIVWVPPSTID